MTIEFNYLQSFTFGALGVGLFLSLYQRKKNAVVSAELDGMRSIALKRVTSFPVNLAPVGPLGGGIIPALREKIKAGFLSAYLSRMYYAEIDSFQGGPLLANCVVAHASKDGSTNTMNIAMPELTAEYWCTFVPSGQAPVLRLNFPAWAVFSAVTAYDTSGLPLASVHAKQAKQDPRVVRIGGKFLVNLMHGCEGSWQGPLSVVFRVYRPAPGLGGLDMCPLQDRPEVRLLNKGSVASEHARLTREAASDPLSLQSLFSLGAGGVVGGDDGAGYMPEGMFDDPPDTETSGYLPQASTEHAIAAGKRFGANFSSIIASKLGALAPEKFGSQFFHPTSVSGLFPNLSATYVVAFLPELPEHEEEKNGGAAAATAAAAAVFGGVSASGAGGSTAAAAAAAVYGGVSVSGAGGGSREGQQRKAPPAKGMRLRGAVPSEEPWRPFFGAMAVSYTTTETVSALVDSQLGGWGNAFTLFASRTEEDARQHGGYNPEEDPTHRLLLWGESCRVPGLVLRYLHYDEVTTEGLSKEGLAASQAEKKGLVALDGTRTKIAECDVPGISKIEYF